MNLNTLTLNQSDGITHVYCPGCDVHVGPDLIDPGPIGQPWGIWHAHLFDVHHWAAHPEQSGE